MQTFSEEWAVIGTIDPQTINDTEVFSDVIDLSKYERVAGVCLSGSMDNSTGTIVFRAVTCDSAGDNAAAFKTASTVAAANADNAQVVVEVDGDDVAGGAANADRYVKFGVVSGTTGGPLAAVILGKAKYGPSSDGDLATVREIEYDKD